MEYVKSLTFKWVFIRGFLYIPAKIYSTKANRLAASFISVTGYDDEVFFRKKYLNSCKVYGSEVEKLRGLPKGSLIDAKGFEVYEAIKDSEGHPISQDGIVQIAQTNLISSIQRVPKEKWQPQQAFEFNQLDSEGSQSTLVGSGVPE